MSWKFGLTWYAKWFYQQLQTNMFNVVCLYFQKGEVAYFKYLFPVLQAYHYKCFTVNVFPVCLSTLLSVVFDSRPKTWSIDLTFLKKNFNMSKIEYGKCLIFLVLDL